MKPVPIAFAFDNNLLMPAGVCISSLLRNACQDTFYDIFILHSEKRDFDKTQFELFENIYKNCQINFVPVGDCFDNAFEIRGITSAAYYRLLIPELIPQYDKVIYSDVDIIFRDDLSELYSFDIESNYIAATYDLGLNLSDDGKKYISSVPGLKQGEYIQSGFLVINSKEIRKDNLVEQFKKEALKNYRYQDQDILNIICGDKKYILPIRYNMTDYTFNYLMNYPNQIEQYATKDEIDIAKQFGTLHFNGHKPWKKYSVNFDVWWQNYRESPIFDERFYFDFFYSKLNEYDRLSLIKRLKILARYFIVGMYK